MSLDRTLNLAARTLRRVLGAWLLAAALVAITSPAQAELPPEVEARLTESEVVAPALLEALRHADTARARIFFTLPGDVEHVATPVATEPTLSPVVFDIANLLLPGELEMQPYEFVRAISGRVDPYIVLELAANPQVITIELDETPPAEELNLLAAPASSCTSSSTVACLDGDRFAVSVGTNIGNMFIAARSIHSAVYYKFGSSTNWEVLVKVLNGCGINSHHWVFAGNATSLPIEILVRDTATGASKTYGNSCPVLDTQAFACP